MDCDQRGERVGIVGARTRTDKDAVEAYVAALPAGTIVVSGGCKGVDKWAAAAARARGLHVEEILPDLHGARSRGEVSRRYYERNGRVVNAIDRLVAFVSLDGKKGGTGNTIDQARAARKPVEIK